jgi:L-ribulose-5-phosphate 4-epimerase
MNYAEIRLECLAANLQLPRCGLVDLNFGNVSVFDPRYGCFAIKPSGVAYDKLRASDMVVVNLEGKVLDGSLRPSSDTPTHLMLFKAFGGNGVRSVVHTHSRCATAFAQAGMPIPCLGTTHADHFHGPVPVTRPMSAEEVRGDYEMETGRVIAECMGTTEPLEMPAVLVRNHGPFAWGASGASAVEAALALEIVADMAMRTLSLKPALESVPNYLLDKHFTRKHGPNAYYGQ